MGGHRRANPNTVDQLMAINAVATPKEQSFSTIEPPKGKPFTSIQISIGVSALPGFLPIRTMKRDLELVRAIMLALETNPHGVAQHPFHDRRLRPGRDREVARGAGLTRIRAPENPPASPAFSPAVWTGNDTAKSLIPKVVRKRGFEPRWYDYRQPLKLSTTTVGRGFSNEIAIYRSLQDVLGCPRDRVFDPVLQFLAKTSGRNFIGSS